MIKKVLFAIVLIGGSLALAAGNVVEVVDPLDGLGMVRAAVSATEILDKNTSDAEAVIRAEIHCMNNYRKEIDFFQTHVLSIQIKNNAKVVSFVCFGNKHAKGLF